MQARLEIRRFPASFFAIAFAVAVALLLGLGVGYALKGPTVTTGPARVLVLGSEGSTPGDGGCIWVNHKKEC
jgi:hypothetical protein